MQKPGAGAIAATLWCTPTSPLFPHCPLPCNACAFQLLHFLLLLLYRNQKAFVAGQKKLVSHTCLDHLHQLSLQMARKQGAVPQKQGVSRESPQGNAVSDDFGGSASLHGPKGAQNTGAVMYAHPCIGWIGRGDHFASTAGNIQEQHCLCKKDICE